MAKPAIRPAIPHFTRFSPLRYSPGFERLDKAAALLDLPRSYSIGSNVPPRHWDINQFPNSAATGYVLP